MSQILPEITRRCSYLLRVRWLCPIQIRKWWLCFPGPPTGSGSCGILHRVLNPQGWTIGFSGWHELVLSHPSWFLSSRRCMKSSLVRGRHLLLPETAPVGPPPSPPLMAVRLRVTRASHLWSGPWLCSCALTPPGAGSRLSLPKPVSTRRTLPAGLTRPVGKPPPPYTLWRCCRSIRPRHWETCTRVVMTHKFITNFVLRRTSRFRRRRLRRGQWAVRCPLWWSRNAISGCVWPTWGIPTKSGSLMPPCPRPASLATRSRTSPSSSRLYRSSLRRLATSCPGGPLLHPLCRRQHLSLLVTEGDPLRLPPLPHRSNSLHPSGAVEPVVGGVPSPSRPPPRGAAKPRARGPRTDDPEMIGTALQEMVTAPLLPPEEGRVVNPLFFPSVPPFSIKEQFLSSPGPKRARRVVGGEKPLHSHPPLLSPADSSAQFEMGTQASPAPPVRPWNQVSVAQHTQTPLRAASQREPPELHPCVPPRCPTAGTPVVPLVPLVRSLRAWLALPSPSRWLIRTIRLGYAIQFVRRPPKFRGVHFTSVKAVDTHVLHAEIAVLLAKDAIGLVPPADMRSGFYSPYFIVPKKSGGLRPILDLRVLNRSLHKLPFKMLMKKRIFECVRLRDWFAAIDLKDAYFHVSILPRHRPFLHFAFEGRAYQYKVLPFGLALSPRVFTKVVEGALVPMREQGVRILNYLDDWLILAQSREQLCEHRDLVLSHLSQLGLQVNWEKSKLAPVQRISFLGMELDSVEQSARLTEERAQSVLNCLNTFGDIQDSGPTETFSEAPGAYGGRSGSNPAWLASYETASALASWPSPEMGVATRHVPSGNHSGMPPNLQPVVRPLVSLGRSSPRAGVPACCSLHGCLCHRLGGHVQWAGSVRGVDGPPTALAHQLPRVASSIPCPGLPEGAVTGQACAGPYGQYCDRCVHQPSRRSALPSHVATRPPSPPLESEASEVASRHSCPWCAQPCGRRALTSCAARRVATPPPGGPADLGGVRRGSGRPVCLARNLPLPVVLLPVRGDTRHRCTGAQLAPGPSQVCVSPSEPTCTDLVQSQGGRGAGLASCALLAQPDLVPGTHAPRDSPSLASSSEKGPSFSETGHPLAPASRPLETPCLVPGWDAEVLGDLPPEVLNTIALARAPSTRRAYALKWNLFVKWCSSRREDPRRCSIGVVLYFLQQGLERRLSPSTLKVHAAAISAYHDHIDGKSIGKHDLVIRFLRGARRLNPPRPPSIPSWDLALVLRALQIAPFEPLQSADLRILSMKTVLLVALASIKRVGDLQAFSVDESCLEFGPGDGHVLLSPRPGYVPKVPTTPFRDQVVSLQALPLEEADPALALLCPVRALRLYTDRTQSLRTSDQLFVCYGDQQKGKAVSKQRMAHWIMDAIALAYQAQGVPCPLRLRAHSTRGVASSWALARGASLTDICRAAGWATPNTFARFYSLRVEPVSSRVLTSGQRHREVPA